MAVFKNLLAVAVACVAVINGVVGISTIMPTHSLSETVTLTAELSHTTFTATLTFTNGGGVLELSYLTTDSTVLPIVMPALTTTLPITSYSIQHDVDGAVARGIEIIHTMTVTVTTTAPCHNAIRDMTLSLPTSTTCDCDAALSASTTVTLPDDTTEASSSSDNPLYSPLDGHQERHYTTRLGSYNFPSETTDPARQVPTGFFTQAAAHFPTNVAGPPQARDEAKTSSSEGTVSCSETVSSIEAKPTNSSTGKTGHENHPTAFLCTSGACAGQAFLPFGETPKQPLPPRPSGNPSPSTRPWSIPSRDPWHTHNTTTASNGTTACPTAGNVDVIKPSHQAIHSFSNLLHGVITPEAGGPILPTRIPTLLHEGSHFPIQGDTTSPSRAFHTEMTTLETSVRSTQF